MSDLTKSSEAFKNAKNDEDYNNALNKMLWDSFYLQSMISDFFKIADGNEVELTLSNNGLRGLAMLLDHCADLTIDAIGIIPSGPLQMAGGNHE